MEGNAQSCFAFLLCVFVVAAASAGAGEHNAGGTLSNLRSSLPSESEPYTSSTAERYAAPVDSDVPYESLRMPASLPRARGATAPAAAAAPRAPSVSELGAQIQADEPTARVDRQKAAASPAFQAPKFEVLFPAATSVGVVSSTAKSNAGSTPPSVDYASFVAAAGIGAGKPGPILGVISRSISDNSAMASLKFSAGFISTGGSGSGGSGSSSGGASGSASVPGSGTSNGQITGQSSGASTSGK